MGVYIDGLDMPKSCKRCPFTCEALQFFNGKGRPQKCPLIEIVRCGECKYAKYKIENAEYVKCMITQLFVSKTDFCSYGERRADGDI